MSKRAAAKDSLRWREGAMAALTRQGRPPITWIGLGLSMTKFSILPRVNFLSPQHLPEISD